MIQEDGENGFRSQEETEAAGQFEAGMAPVRAGFLGPKISEGSHADVHDAEASSGLLVKIGKTEEYSPPLLKALKVSFPRQKLSRILEKIFGPQFKIYPDEDFIKNGVAEYLLIREYFGCESQPGETPSITNGSEVGATLLKNHFGYEKKPLGQDATSPRAKMIDSLRDPGDPFYQDLIKVLGDADSLGEVVRVLESHQGDNYLPKEQTVIGHPPTLAREQAAQMMERGQKLPSTYYIFQEKIQGPGVIPLTELNDDKLAGHPKLIEKLLAFAVLTKKMYSDTGQMIDMRADEVAKHPLEWFQKTANVLVDLETDQLHFVDTRWLYDKNSRIGEKGINLIHLLGVKSVDRAIRKYSRLLQSAAELRR